jgi:tetratricopeptide (TPR) repeat protein
VEAARLCEVCQGGQILITDTVRSMAGRRSPHRFVSLGEQELRGIPEPVVVCEVQWERSSIPLSGIPLPDFLADTETSALFGFFGRQREMEVLDDALKSAADGRRQIAFVRGEAGVGKTALCRQVAQGAHRRGVCVVNGRCDEDLGVAYQPFSEALTHLIVHVDDAFLETHVRTYQGALANLVPALLTRLPDLPIVQTVDPDTERLRVFTALIGILSAAAEEGGLLLVVDDVQWADRASLQLLRYIAGSGQLSKVMVLGTYRDSEVSIGGPLSETMAGLRRQTDVIWIDLGGLGDAEIVEMIERVAGHELDEKEVELARVVRRETEGNPFFATEMLLHMSEVGLVHQDESGRWVPSDDLYQKGLPQSVREVVGQRVARLGEDVRRVLSLAAVIGREFDLDLLVAVDEMDEDGLLDLIDRATDASLLIEVKGLVERFSFTHALTQHTLYDELGATRRARAHRKIAEVLEDLCADNPGPRAGELARHFMGASQAGDAMKALIYLQLAGDEAVKRLAPADALGWFAQALDLYRRVPPNEKLHFDLLLGLGIAQRQSGDPTHRDTLLQASAIAAMLDDPERAIRAALANSRGGPSVAGQVDDERVSVLNHALEVAGESDSGDRALLLATLAVELSFSGERDRIARLVDEALSLGRRLGDRVVLLRVIGIVYETFFLPDNLDDRLPALDEAVSISRTIGDRSAGLQATSGLAIACLQAGNRSGFDTNADAYCVLADEFGEAGERWLALILRSMRCLLEGDTAGAEELANAALALAADGQPDALEAYGSQMLLIRHAQGRLNEMVDLFARTVADNPGLAVLRCALAWMYCELDRHEEALATIEADIADGFSHIPYDLTWLLAMTALAEVCARLGKSDAAKILYNRLLPWHAQVSCAIPTMVGPVAMYLGMLAGAFESYQEAEAFFAEALDVAQKLDAPYWAARTRLELATMLTKSARSYDDRVRPLLASCLDTARQYGFAVLETRATALL